MDRILSYCIAVKNRPDELLQTLSFNLEENSRFSEVIDFVVGVFDGDTALVGRLEAEHAEDIRSGYLKVFHLGGLDVWHFGRAKNRFRSLPIGALFSSLDADNFVSAEETGQILDAYSEYGADFIFHHFSGRWGDGTCGRVTLGSETYRAVGYDESFMPRQFDEVDFIVSSLRHDRNLPLLAYSEGGIFGQSPSAQLCLDEIGMVLRSVVKPDLRRRLPLNPKGQDYVPVDPVLEQMTLFNRARCLAKCAQTAEAAEKFLAAVRAAADRLVDGLDRTDVLRSFFGMAEFPAFRDGPVPVISCIRDDGQFLDDWYRHYKKLGCGPFFIVDNGSSPPIRELLPHDDVHVLTPAAGCYRSCKSVWIKAAMKAFLGEGRWAVTVDSDELVDVLGDCGTIGEVVDRATAAGHRFVPGMLVDLLPGPSLDAEAALAQGSSVVEVFDHHLFDAGGDRRGYVDSDAIRWAFGRHWLTSFCVDVRYRLFGTVDVLRKVPLIRYEEGIRINQGFHDVAYADQKTLPSAVWGGDFLLPIRHYKLSKLFQPATRLDMATAAAAPAAYHPRTRENLRRMASTPQEDVTRSLQRLGLRKYDADFFDGRQIHKAARRKGRGAALRTLWARISGRARESGIFGR